MAATRGEHVLLNRSLKLLPELIGPLFCVRSRDALPRDAAGTLNSLGPPRRQPYSSWGRIQTQGQVMLPHLFSEISPLSSDTEQHESGSWNVLSANVLYWAPKAYLHYRILSCK